MDCDYDTDDMESDEELNLLKKALDVELPKNFDPKHVPQNGEEYIQYVMYEAKQCEKLMVATIDANKLKKRCDSVEVREACMEAPKRMQMTSQWQQQQADDFIHLTKCLNRKMRKTERSRNIQEQHLRELLTTTIPTVSELSKFTQYDKLNVLNVILDEMDEVKSGDSLNYKLGIWIYSTLATLDVPLCPEFTHTLRELARKCSVIRANLAETSNDFLQLNLIVCIIAKCFNQFDLIDECLE